MTSNPKNTGLALVVEFNIKLEFIQSFELAIRENALASLASEPGCHYFDVCRDPADPTLFFLYEVYEDQAAIRLHLMSAHFLTFDTLTRDWVSRKVVKQMQRI